MKCHYCQEETDQVVRFSDCIERPYCGCQDRGHAEDWARYQANSKKSSRERGHKMSKRERYDRYD
jgi:hypothetical protein